MPAWDHSRPDQQAIYRANRADDPAAGRPIKRVAADAAFISGLGAVSCFQLRPYEGATVSGNG
jgi:hypothetical protein